MILEHLSNKEITMSVSHSHQYTCPMHSEVRQNHPGDCPKCGMHLVPVTEQKQAQTYTCPMHPEVQQDQPGDCPKCGMHLVLKHD